MPRRPFPPALLHALAAVFLAAAGALSTPASAQDDGKNDQPALPAVRLYLLRDDAMRFADEVAKRRELDPAWTRHAIGQALYQPDAARLMLPPPAHSAAKNWRIYRSRFLDAAHIRAGVDFWQRNRAALARAQGQFGVPPEIIAGIVGIETLYGQRMGGYHVIDALATLAFDFPAEHPRAAARQAFFQDELEQFLLLCRRTGMDPGAPLGSYAGAMGMAQFMPSSWNRYAIDYDGDGRIDLWQSQADAIGSVANYLKQHGWQSGQPTHYPVRLADDADLNALLAPDILPSFSPASLAAKGAHLSAAGLAHPGLLALIELQNGDPALPGNAPTYLAGTQNFYVITRYNWSAYYAMAVIDLGDAVAAAVNSQATQEQNK